MRKGIKWKILDRHNWQIFNRHLHDYVMYCFYLSSLFIFIWQSLFHLFPVISLCPVNRYFLIPCWYYTFSPYDIAHSWLYSESYTLSPIIYLLSFIMNLGTFFNALGKFNESSLKFNPSLNDTIIFTFNAVIMVDFMYLFFFFNPNSLTLLS